MRVSDAKTLVGKIVVLDMVNSLRLTTKVEAVEQEGQNFFMVCGHLIMFILQPVGMGQPGTKQFQAKLVDVIPYGFPDFAPTKQTHIDLTHILTASLSPDDIAQNYARMTSSIIPAAAQNMPSMDALGDMMAKLSK